MIHYEETGSGDAEAEIGGSAHLPNMERPAEFDAALLSFLDQ